MIIKQGTKFTLTLETPSKIEAFYFYCLSELPIDDSNTIDFSNEQNSTRTMTAISNCVPMLSVSDNIPLVMTIESENWIKLPIFNSDLSSLTTSVEMESDFYKSVQIFGFVENYYTQMLLSLNDIRRIGKKSVSLSRGLQNHFDIVEYYDYLTNGEKSPLDRTTLFIRSEEMSNFPNFQHRETYFNLHSISVVGEMENFLTRKKESSQTLLNMFANYYNREEIVDGFGETLDLWNDIFAKMYQLKFGNREILSPIHSSVTNYRYGSPLTKWNHEEKLNFLLSIFAYDGTDTPLREFRIRYRNNSQNLFSTVLEVFLDIYDLNLLPFLEKFIDFKKFTIPVLKIDLELRLLTGRGLMPAIDFNLKPSQLQTKSRERDFRRVTPLTLVSKVKKNYHLVKFVLVSPIDLTGRCLHLNNKCETIVKNSLKIQLSSGVYSTYIAEESEGNFYTSEIMYHSINKQMIINLKVKKIEKNEVFLPLVYYNFHAHGISDEMFLQMFINYKEMTIGIKQLTNHVHDYFKDTLYFSVSLERDNSVIFNYEFFGLSKKSLLNVVHKFRENDRINIFHREPERLKLNIDNYNNDLTRNIFIFTNVGLKMVASDVEFKFISSDIQRIDKFIRNYSVDLSYNELFKFYLSCYIRSLYSENLEKFIPNHWLVDSN